MAKTFYTSGTGSQQTLTPSQNEKVAIYDTIADAEADLVNLEAGQIVATPDTGDELAQPVNEVTANNLHSVTSNAVALFLSGYLRFETVESESFTINAGASLDVAVTIPQIDGYSIGIVFYYRNQNSNALYSGKYILNTGTTSGTAWMYNPSNTAITTKIEVIVMYIKNV